MKIAYISGGAAGMYCGSCIHDNTVAGALQRLGHDAVLTPLYTPLRTDEASVSIDRVFYGAINTYLQLKSPFFRRLPRPLARWLDRPSVLKWVSRLGGANDAEELGAMALAVLQGEEGATADQLEQLVLWLADDLKPQLVHLQNSMLVGFAPEIKRRLGVPLVCSLQGEDLFLDGLTEPYRSQAFEVLRQRLQAADAFVVNSEYYGDHMAAYLGIDRDRIHTVRLGLNLEDLAASAPAPPADDEVFTVGYLARRSPEKGLHLAVDAFRLLAEQAGAEKVRLKVAGYLAPKDESFHAALLERLDSWGLASRVEVVGEVDREGKVAFLHSVDALAVPTVYREPKGLFALEAMASGVPVVLPRHGAFPEMVEATGGGLLVEPGSPEAVAKALETLLRQPETRLTLGAAGRQAVRRDHTSEGTAEALLGLYDGLMGVQVREATA